VVPQDDGEAWQAGRYAVRHPSAYASCGYKFANEGKDTRSLQAYLGHRNIQSTVRYTAMAPDWFKGWEND
jgi:site-specific recombinase XerD